MPTTAILQRAIEQGKGILRLAPAWVPRSFCIPGRRIKLHPDDYYSYGGERGGIDERWFASTTPADNGPLTSPNEGLSAIVFEDGERVEKVLLRDAVTELKGELIGKRLWQMHQAWPIYAKFFDHPHPLGHHIHHRDKHAALVGMKGKPEAYYYPAQVNATVGDFPFTFLGLEPGTTKAQVKECLANFSAGDNKITALSKAYRLVPGTGWDVPAGVLHAPGSLCTYEVQAASDVFAIYQSVIMGRMVVSQDLLWKNTPPDKRGNLDHLIDVIDWDANVDPLFGAHHFMAPKPVRSEEEMRAEGFIEKWICWRSDAYSAKELTVLPGRSATIRDGGAYGIIMLQGHGKMGAWDIETPAMIRFGQLTHDEFFVSESAARSGVTIVNRSSCDPLVMIKHFGPGNPDLNVA
jgi:hypothetical protein